MKYPACKLAIPKWKGHFQNSTTKPSTHYSIARPTLGRICWVSVPYARVRAYRIRMSIARCLMTHRTTVRERAPDPANPLGRLESTSSASLYCKPPVGCVVVPHASRPRPRGSVVPSAAGSAQSTSPPADQADSGRKSLRLYRPSRLIRRLVRLFEAWH